MDVPFSTLDSDMWNVNVNKAKSTEKMCYYFKALYINTKMLENISSTAFVLTCATH